MDRFNVAQGVPFCVRRSGIAVAPAQQGLTLVELLIAMAVGFVTLASAGVVLLLHLRTTGGLELAQRQRDNAVRLDYLMQIEASEAALVRTNQSLSACEGASGVNSFATFVVPRDEGDYQSLLNVSLIHYYNQAGSVWRCGPPVAANGVLIHYDGDGNPSGLQSGIAVREASLTAPTGGVCQGQSTNDRQLVYQLTFSEPAYAPDCSIARVRTVRID